MMQRLMVTTRMADKARSTETRAVEKKRAEPRRIAEQQRKQRELEVATIAVRRIIHERDASDAVVVSDQAERPLPTGLLPKCLISICSRTMMR